MSNSKKIAFIIEHSALKGYYPFERAVHLATEMKRNADVHLFMKHAPQQAIESSLENGVTPILFEYWRELYASVRNMQFDLIVIDSDSVAQDCMQQLSAYCGAIVHLDDVGERAKESLYHFTCFEEELFEGNTENVVVSPYFFIPDKQLLTIRNERLLRAIPITETNTPPHVVIYFEHGDPFNCTYRTLRHLVQLHIPIQISVIIDEYYAHELDDLKLMVLSRKRCQIVQTKQEIERTLINADCLICNHVYTPYKAAYIQIPCITAAQYEPELNFTFPREENGFTHIGLGRKMKQSHLQNAVMEVLLHETIRTQMIKRQQAIQFDSNRAILPSLLHHIAHEEYNISSLLK